MLTQLPPWQRPTPSHGALVGCSYIKRYSVVFWHGVRGTNTKAEVMALLGLLWFKHFVYIPFIHIHGNSNVIMQHLNESAKISNPLVLGWLMRIKQLWTLLKNSTINRVHREKNMIGDELSKMGLNMFFRQDALNYYYGPE